MRRKTGLLLFLALLLIGSIGWLIHRIGSPPPLSSFEQRLIGTWANYTQDSNDASKPKTLQTLITIRPDRTIENTYYAGSPPVATQTFRFRWHIEGETLVAQQLPNSLSQFLSWQVNASPPSPDSIRILSITADTFEAGQPGNSIVHERITDPAKLAAE